MNNSYDLSKDECNHTNDKRIQRFLKEACPLLMLPSKKKVLCDELYNHLLEAIDHYLEEGLSREVAVIKALEAMGSSSNLRSDFARIHRRELGPILLGGAALSLTLLFLAALYTVHKGMQEIQSDMLSRLTANVDRFTYDQKILSKKEMFEYPGMISDAGPFLNPKIQWEVGTEPERKLYDFLNKDISIGIKEEWRNRLTEKGSQWTDHINDKDADQILRFMDFSWMTDLSKFDHWDLFQWESMHSLLQSSIGATSWFLFPMPDFMSLQTMAKWRLIQGLRQGKLLPALKEVHQLARLIYSTELLVSSAVAVALYRAESAAFKIGLDRQLVQPGDFEVLTENEGARAKRAVFAYSGVFQLGTETSDNLPFRSGDIYKAGYCGAVSENVVSWAMEKRFFGSPLPLEYNPVNYDKMMQEVFTNAQRHCRLTYSKVLMKNPKAIAQWLSLENPTASWSEKFKWNYLPEIPWIRQIIAYDLFRIAVPNFISGPYENNKLEGE